MSNLKFRSFVCFLHLLYLPIFKGIVEVNCEVNEKIIIIGAGPSGIAAASKLFENGFTNITILEAENRIGGRLYTTKLGNYLVDLGGQWVHGVEGNTAFKLAYPLGLLDMRNGSRYDDILYDSAGNIVSSEVNNEFVKFFEKLYVEGDESIENITNAKTFGEYVDKAFTRDLKDVPELINNKKKYLHYMELFALSLDPADSWNDIPAQFNDGYNEYEGDQHVNWKTRGYGTILEILMKSYPDPKKELPVRNNTLLNSEVTSIDYSNGKINESIIVTTKDGKVYAAKHVIVTVSLGVLKERHQTFFTPLLPAEKVKAIEGIDFGCVGKVFLLFERPFWQNDDVKTIVNGFLWDEADRKIVEQDPEKMWVLGVIAQSVEHKPNVLEFFISSGKYTKAMEKLPEDKVFDQSIQLLERFMGKTHNISRPIAMIRSQWCTNPHFRGTYSYRSLDSMKRNFRSSALAESVVPENLKILFAGEATSRHRWSTADGAIESGWVAAEKLTQFYKLHHLELY